MLALGQQIMLANNHPFASLLLSPLGPSQLAKLGFQNSSLLLVADVISHPVHALSNYLQCPTSTL